MQSSVSSAVAGKSGILKGVSHAGLIHGYSEKGTVDCPHPDAEREVTKLFAQENIHSIRDIVCRRCKKCRPEGRAPIVS